MPKDRWHEINHLLVGLGQTVCLPVGRRCGECVLAERGLCPGAVVAKKGKEKVKKVETGKGEKEGEVEVKVEMGVEKKEEEVKLEDLEDFQVSSSRALRSRAR